jgi:predicted metal-dependent phosphoesterase TrpH
LKIDFHVHSFLSYDCDSKLEDIAYSARQKQIDIVFLCDHNELLSSKPEVVGGVLIIPGEEIATSEGEIVGFFLKEKVTPGLSLEETITAIKKQDGVIYIPHPLDVYRKAIGLRKTIKIIDQIDVLEVLNYKSLFQMERFLVSKIADKYKKPKAAGSDAHRPGEVGNCFVEFDVKTKVFLRNKKDLLDLFNKKYRLHGKSRGFVKAVIKKVFA